MCPVEWHLPSPPPLPPPPPPLPVAPGMEGGRSPLPSRQSHKQSTQPLVSTLPKKPDWIHFKTTPLLSPGNSFGIHRGFWVCVQGTGSVKPPSRHPPPPAQNPHLYPVEDAPSVPHSALRLLCASACFCNCTIPPAVNLLLPSHPTSSHAPFHRPITPSPLPPPPLSHPGPGKPGEASGT